MRGSGAIVLLRSVFLVVAVCFATSCAQAGEAPMPTGAEAGDATLLNGRTIWINRCQRCHGPTGNGGAGPRLQGRMITAYPDPAAEIAVVRDGKGSGMPAWKSVLSEADIAAVVEYTRRVL